MAARGRLHRLSYAVIPPLIAATYRRYVLNALIQQINCIGDIMRLLHTMLRVGDLQRSIGDFYTNVLGMKLLRTSENPVQILPRLSSATA